MQRKKEENKHININEEKKYSGRGTARTKARKCTRMMLPFVTYFWIRKI